MYSRNPEKKYDKVLNDVTYGMPSFHKCIYYFNIKKLQYGICHCQKLMTGINHKTAVPKALPPTTSTAVAAPTIAGAPAVQ